MKLDKKVNSFAAGYLCTISSLFSSDKNRMCRHIWDQPSQTLFNKLYITILNKYRIGYFSWWLTFISFQGYF